MPIVIKIAYPSYAGDVQMGMLANFIDTGGFPSGWVRCDGQLIENFQAQNPEFANLLAENGFIQLPQKTSMLCEARPYERRDSRSARYRAATGSAS